MVRKVVGYIKHDISNEVSDGGDCWRRDVVEGKHFIGFSVRGSVDTVIEVQAVAPINRQDHHAHVRAEMVSNGFVEEFEIHETAEGVGRIGEVKRFNPFGKLLSYSAERSDMNDGGEVESIPVNDQKKVSNLAPLFFVLVQAQSLISLLRKPSHPSTRLKICFQSTGTQRSMFIKLFPFPTRWSVGS